MFRLIEKTNGTLMKKIALFCLISLVWAIKSANAQYVYDYKRTADVYFASGDYYSSAQYYNKALGTFNIKPEQILPYALEKKGKEPARIKDYETVVYRLAESYRLYADFGNAEKTYEQVVGFNNNTMFPLARYWYGVCLRANRKYQEALDQFKQFKQTYTSADEISARTALEIASCEFAIEQAAATPRFTLTKLGGNVNEGGANYAAAVIDPNTILYTSSRPEKSVVEAKNDKKKKENPYVNDFYIAEGSATNFDKVSKVNIPETKGMHQGVGMTTTDGTNLYLTRWSYKNGERAAAIYLSKKQGTGWTEPQALGANVNVPGYSSMQPFVTDDGKYLLFASNRPGGMGKYDLWYCPLSNGSPGAARNMGTGINSRDEDQAPFYDAEKKALMFSSDGRIGLGGLDFYVSEGDFSNWTTPRNMGAPMNSSKDDIYYTAANKEHPLAAGFISSDRESVCCLEVFAIKKNSKIVSGQILDCDDGLPLTGARVTLLDTTVQKVLQQVTLNETGRYSFEVDPLKKYKVLAEKENYFSKAIYFSTEELTKVDSLINPTICLKRYEIGKPIILKDIYYDFNKATLREQSKVVLDTVVSIMQDNQNIVIEMSAHTDSKGSDAYNMKLSQARAQACVDYLISRGIPSSRMIAKGYGETRPIAPNTINGKDNPDGRQLNRRTEFKVLRNL